MITGNIEDGEMSEIPKDNQKVFLKDDDGIEE